jgi:hypothetical protein
VPLASFHSQHAPFGAFASFTVGLLDSPGGFGQALSGPATQNLYIGYRRQDASSPWRLLPYYRRTVSQEGNFQEIKENFAAGPGVEPIAASQFTRELSWCSDTWRADRGRFGFGLLSPITEVPEPRAMSRRVARRHLVPAVGGWIEYDNRAGKRPVELMFGLGEPTQPLRTVEGDVTGFARGTQYGFATRPGRDVSQRQGFDLFPSKFRDYRGLHAIGGEAALVFTVPAGCRRRFPLALGFYQSGQVTTGLAAEYYYAQLFANLEDVLAHALAEHAWYERTATTRDRELAVSGLDADQQFLIAQATHSYLGSTELLRANGQPLWVVNEGEYRMMITFDLTVDHLFYELRWHPWTICNTLDLFVRRYAYVDRLKVDGRLVAGGISFTHDMGVANQFTAPRHSSYECDNLRGCFSHMSMEQLLNWVLCAITYAAKTGDGAWLRRNRAVIAACAESLHRRDHPTPAKRDGVLKMDSSRCGSGSEITTYDSLDVSLGQARNNLYLAVKTLGAWILLEKGFALLGDRDASADARATADRLAATLCDKFEREARLFPAVFEAGNTSRIIPAIEGLAYPLFLGLDDVLSSDGRFRGLLGLLEQHISAVLQPGVCLDARTGGWKMSSTSTNTWFSKIALCQWVVQRLFPRAMTAAAKRGDRVHADWQRQPGCGQFAMCDQIRSDTGEACGSRYYPRGVTTILWLENER